MASPHMISNLERTQNLSAGSLILLSEPQNKYNSVWKSKSITAGDMADGIEIQFRRDNFSEDLGLLQDINDTFLNSGNLTINYDSANDKVQLLWDGEKFSEFDSSRFVTQGMIENAYVKDGKLVIVFRLSGGGTKEVKIDLGSLVDVYYAGNGLCCENKTFRIDPDVVSVKGHAHDTGDITDFETKISVYEKTENLKSAAYKDIAYFSLSSHAHDNAYSKLGHKHVAGDITDFPTGVSHFENDAGYLSSHLTYGEISSGIKLSEYEKTARLGTAAYTQVSDYLDEKDFRLAYTAGDDILWLSVGDSALSAKITTSGGSGGVTYEYVKSALSNDGYCVTFIDWDD